MRPALPLLALLLAEVGFAQSPIDALDPLTREIYVDAERLEADGALQAARLKYRQVLDRDPAWTQAVIDLGRVLQALEDPDAAEAIYRTAPYEADVVEALGRLLLSSERYDEAAIQLARMRNLRPDTAEFLVLEAQATGASDPLRGREVLLEYLGRPNAQLATEGAMSVAAGIARALREADRDEEASKLLDALDERLTEEGVEAEDPHRIEVEDLRDRFAVERQARDLAAVASEPLTPEQRGWLTRARAQYRAGDHEGAAVLLQQILDEAPGNADTWATLSDTRLALGDVAGAERALRTAERLAPLESNHAARLGDLLYAQYGGRFASEAAAAYARALSRHDADPGLWYRRGLAELRAREPGAAALSMRRYLAFDPVGEHADEARRIVEGSERVRPEGEPVVPRRDRPTGVSEEAWERFHIAVVYERRGGAEDLTRALEELALVRALAPTLVSAVNLEAAVHLARGDIETATARYEQSLEQQPDQVRVKVILADLRRRSGDPETADALLEEAAALGSADAHLRLAQREEAAGRLWRARTHLDAYFGATTYGVADEDAASLSERVDAAISRRWLLVGSAVAGGVGLPILWWIRRQGGQDLRTLLERSPSAWPDVARIASAIRHEVLKHNTTVLSAVAEALVDQRPEPAIWAADRLFATDGAIARFREHVAALELLGRVHGVRLNLRHRDPVFRPLVGAIDRLCAIEGALRTGSPRVAREVGQLAVALNQTGYRALGHLLQRVCLLPLDTALIDGVWHRVAAEIEGPAPPFSVELPSEPVVLRIFRGELEDILANLLRNCAEAVSAVDGGRVGVEVAFEEDAITGLERVAIRVRDDAPRRITTAMIRGRYIGRGLGLAVDLISRNGGSIHVEDAPGWAKAVVVRLPRAEAPDLEETE